MSLENAVYALLGWQVLASARIGGKDAVAVRKRKRRELVYDHVIHSCLYDNTIYTGQCWDYLLPLASVSGNPRILIIGLGGGTLPFQIMKKFKRAEVEVVEISREMVRLSAAFLPERLAARVILGDGLEYVKRRKNAYDLIIMDAFVGSETPGAFFSRSFADNARKALKSNGILGINYIFTFRSLPKRRAFVESLKELFNVYQIAYPRSSYNSILVCSKRYGMAEISKRIERNFKQDGGNRQILKAYSNQGIRRL